MPCASNKTSFHRMLPNLVFTSSHICLTHNRLHGNSIKRCCMRPTDSSILHLRLEWTYSSVITSKGAPIFVSYKPSDDNILTYEYAKQISAHFSPKSSFLSLNFIRSSLFVQSSAAIAINSSKSAEAYYRHHSSRSGVCMWLYA